MIRADGISNLEVAFGLEEGVSDFAELLHDEIQLLDVGGDGGIEDRAEKCERGHIEL